MIFKSGKSIQFFNTRLEKSEKKLSNALGDFLPLFCVRWNRREKKIRINLKAYSTSGFFYFQQRFLLKERSLLKKNSYSLWVKSICLNVNFCIKTGGISTSSVIKNGYIWTLEVDYWLTSNWYGSVNKFNRKILQVVTQERETGGEAAAGGYLQILIKHFMRGKALKCDLIWKKEDLINNCSND